MSSFRQVPAFYFEISCISHHCIFITSPQLVQLVFIIGSCLICDRLPPPHHGNRPTHCFQMLLHGDRPSSSWVLSAPLKGNVLIIWIVVTEVLCAPHAKPHCSLIHTHTHDYRGGGHQLWVVTVCAVSYPRSFVNGRFLTNVLGRFLGISRSGGLMPHSFILSNCK